MGDDAAMTIGQFSRISGLSVHTLRHYDDVGLLRPAEVDPSTGYRLYRGEQVGRARVVRTLRRIGLPIVKVAAALDDDTGEVVRGELTIHRARLSRQRRLVAAQITELDSYLEKGISTSPTAATPRGTARPRQLKLAVDDLDAGIAFYQEVFGFRSNLVQRPADERQVPFVFGTYGEDDFFVLRLLGETAVDRPGPSTFGLVVDDLEATHARALAAGATEVGEPHDAPEGSPRYSAIRDPSGNWIWLYQG